MADIEIVAIGNEILSGITINSNAAFISNQLSKIGFDITRHTVLPDDPQALKAALKEVLSRSPIVICTGGLGPTCDDLTRQVAAELFDSPLHFNQAVADDLIKRYGKAVLPSLKDQATVPDKAKLLKNPLGTASGLIFQDKGSTVILLPGVPVEMKQMLTDQVIPFLIEVYPIAKRSYHTSLHLFELFESSVDPLLRELKKEYPPLDFGIYPSLGLLTVVIKVRATNEKEALLYLTPAKERIASQFASNVFDSPSGKIEEAVHHLLIDKKQTLSIAESCTGGAISSTLTHLAGASAYFLGSVVSYSNQIKMDVLHVKAETLQKHGAVSEETVREMIKGILQLTQSDWGIAITGIAGPSGGTPEKPVGTIWAAVGQKGKKEEVWKFKGWGSREMIIQRGVNVVLAKLYRMLKEDES